MFYSLVPKRDPCVDVEGPAVEKLLFVIFVRQVHFGGWMPFLLVLLERSGSGNKDVPEHYNS